MNYVYVLFLIRVGVLGYCVLFFIVVFVFIVVLGIKKDS